MHNRTLNTLKYIKENKEKLFKQGLLLGAGQGTVFLYLPIFLKHVPMIFIIRYKNKNTHYKS